MAKQKKDGQSGTATAPATPQEAAALAGPESYADPTTEVARVEAITRGEAAEATASFGGETPETRLEQASIEQEAAARERTHAPPPPPATQTAVAPTRVEQLTQRGGRIKQLIASAEQADNQATRDTLLKYKRIGEELETAKAECLAIREPWEPWCLPNTGKSQSWCDKVIKIYQRWSLVEEAEEKARQKGRGPFSFRQALARVRDKTEPSGGKTKKRLTPHNLSEMLAERGIAVNVHVLLDLLGKFGVKVEEDDEEGGKEAGE